MPPRMILAIDQGTTNTKALLVDEHGAVAARASRALSQRYPQPAWVEQDALDIWASVCGAVDECLAAGRAAGPYQLVGLGLSNQREATLIWERGTGRPLGPVIGWQCQRTAPYCAGLRARGLEPLLRRRTGLTIDPMFSATKARWLLDNIPDGQARAAAGELCLGTMDSWLLWKLTGGAVHACDATNASRTQLFDLHTLAWDTELLDVFGLPAPILPRILPSSGFLGATVPLGELPGGLPIAGLVGDSHGALFGHGRFAAGTIKATYGTGSSLMAPTAAPAISERGLSTTVAWSLSAVDRAVYALEGNIYATGAAVQWLGEILGLPDPAAGVEALARQAEGSGGAYFVPAFGGLGAPHWDSAARATWTGITLGTGRPQMARAALEAVAYQVRDVFDAMAADLGGLSLLLADGGASRNDLLMQFQANIIGVPVERSSSADLSALGAAYLAGMALGVWPRLEDVAACVPPGDRFEPRMAAAEREARYGGWRAALARARLPL